MRAASAGMPAMLGLSATPNAAPTATPNAAPTSAPASTSAAAAESRDGEILLRIRVEQAPHATQPGSAPQVYVAPVP